FQQQSPIFWNVLEYSGNFRNVFVHLKIGLENMKKTGNLELNSSMVLLEITLTSILFSETTIYPWLNPLSPIWLWPSSTRRRSSNTWCPKIAMVYTSVLVYPDSPYRNSTET